MKERENVHVWSWLLQTICSTSYRLSYKEMWVSWVFQNNYSSYSSAACFQSKASQIWACSLLSDHLFQIRAWVTLPLTSRKALQTETQRRPVLIVWTFLKKECLNRSEYHFRGKHPSGCFFIGNQVKRMDEIKLYKFVEMLCKRWPNVKGGCFVHPPQERPPNITSHTMQTGETELE